jgi:hypothetical protein
MMTTNGKQKGARAEREICGLLLAWWLTVEPMIDGEPLTFKRTPGSGGWAHGKGRAAFGTSADVVTNAKRFPFAVEAKHREGWAESTLVAGKKSPVWGWWKQACSQALEVKKVPMLWFRKNRASWLVLLPESEIVRFSNVPLWAGWGTGVLAHLALPIHPVAFLASDILGVEATRCSDYTSQLVKRSKKTVDP